MFYIKKSIVDSLLNYGFYVKTNGIYTEYKKYFYNNKGFLSTILIIEKTKDEGFYISNVLKFCDNDFRYIKLIHDLINEGIIEWRDEHDN